MNRNDAQATAERPTPDLSAARRDLTAARRSVRTLTAALEQTGGQELFAGHPSSLAARLRGARGTVSDCEARLGAGRAHLSVVPDSASPRPGVAELFDRWQAAHTIANSPTRPQGPGALRTQAQVGLQDATVRAGALRAHCAMLPSKHRTAFADAAEGAERRQAYQLDLLHQLEDPEHPAAVELRAWELRYPDADQAAAEARAILDYEVTEWALCAQGPTHTPPLPPNVSPADREMWLTAVATQLAYRERYSVTESTPLGAQPWAADQARAWDEARMELARVGVDVTSATQATPGKRRSLNAALAGIG